MKISKKLYQWDTDQYFIQVDGKYMDCLIKDEIYRIEVIDGKCLIPDELLQESGLHTVYECFEKGTRTEYRFNVTERPIPPDYVYTPTRHETFTNLVNKVDSAVSDLEVLKNSIDKEMIEVKKSVSDGKALLADVITEKGIDTASDDSFKTMAYNIGLIDTESDKGYKYSECYNNPIVICNLQDAEITCVDAD